jgi:hypothetical protein
LAYLTGLVNQQLLLENEYLAAENRILKASLQPAWRLSDVGRATLAEIGTCLGRKGLEQVAPIAKTRYHSRLVWLRNLTAPNSAARAVDLAPVQKSMIWWFTWLARTPAGAMTGL